MIHLRDIRYVRLGTPRLDEAERYATEILGLQVARRTPRAVYLRSDDRDHTLVYVEGRPDDHVVGFEIDSAEELDGAASQLDDCGFQVSRGTREDAEQRHVADFVRFTDPSGNPIELVLQPHHSGRRYFGHHDAGIEGFSHVGLRTLDASRDERFWTSLLGARVSDRIGDAPLLRIDPVHHKIALFKSDRPGVQHVNHQVESIDDLMRAWYLLQEKGVRILFGPGRDPTSGARFLYFEGPDAMTYEFSTGVRLIAPEDEAGYRPRQFPPTFESFCMWGARPDIPEFRK